MSSADTPKRSMRTPLGRVRNLGAAHSGTSDFWRQRITGVAMTLLMIPAPVSYTHLTLPTIYSV